MDAAITEHRVTKRTHHNRCSFVHGCQVKIVILQFH